VYPKGADSMAVFGFRFRNALAGSGWDTAVVLCTNVLRKLSSRNAQCPFPVGNPLPQSGQAVVGGECRDYC